MKVLFVVLYVLCAFVGVFYLGWYNTKFRKLPPSRYTRWDWFTSSLLSLALGPLLVYATIKRRKEISKFYGWNEKKFE
jgi:hypothetical protein